MLRNISSKGFDPQNDIDPTLLEHTLSALNRAVDMTFGEVNYSDTNFEFVSELKYNNTVFAAFKTHSQQKAIHEQMWDDKGKTRSFSEFRKATEPIIGQYNTNWLQTEYNTAVIRAQFAAQWREMEASRDIFPNVQWLPSTSVNPRSKHQALYYKVFAFDDPYITSNPPGSLWGCKCGMKSTAQPITDSGELLTAKRNAPKAQSGLDENPAISRSLFSSSHPYVTSCSKKERQSVELWCTKELTASSRAEVRKFFKGMKPQNVMVSDGPVDSVRLSYQDVKRITGKPHKYGYARNMAMYMLPVIMGGARYEGSSPEIKAENKRHNHNAKWHYYSFTLFNQKSYITISEQRDSTKVLYSIQDDDHFKSEKIKEKSKLGG